MKERLSQLSDPVLVKLGDRLFERAHQLMGSGDHFGLDLTTFMITYPRKGNILLYYFNEAKRRAQQKRVMHS